MTERDINIERENDLLDGSMGAAGFLESGGRLAYAGSSLVMWPGEFFTVVVRLREKITE